MRMRQRTRAGVSRSMTKPPARMPTAPSKPRTGPIEAATSAMLMPWTRSRKVGVQAPAAKMLAPIRVTPARISK